MERLKKIIQRAKKFLTGMACPGENTNTMEHEDKNRMSNGVPFMAQVFRDGDVRTASSWPHRACATKGIFHALHGKRGLI